MSDKPKYSMEKLKEHNIISGITLALPFDNEMLFLSFCLKEKLSATDLMNLSVFMFSEIIEKSEHALDLFSRYFIEKTK